MTQPYTHAMHAHKCHSLAVQGVNLDRVRVLVQKRGITYCGRIAGCWTTPDGLDCWTVETSSPEIARFTVPVKQVRECGPGCVCVGGLDS